MAIVWEARSQHLLLHIQCPNSPPLCFRSPAVGYSTCLLSQTDSPSAWSPCSCIPDGFSMPFLPLLSAPNLTLGPSPPGPTVLPSSSPGSSFHLPIKSSPQNPLLVSKFQAPRIRESSNSKHPGQDFLPPLVIPNPTESKERGRKRKRQGRDTAH